MYLGAREQSKARLHLRPDQPGAHSRSSAMPAGRTLPGKATQGFAHPLRFPHYLPHMYEMKTFPHSGYKFFHH